MTTPPLRPTPYDLVFAPIAAERFPAIRTAFEASKLDARDRDAFLLTREAVVLIRELRPEAGLGEGIDQLAALLHHAYLYWDAGELTRTLSPEELGKLLDHAPRPASNEALPAAVAPAAVAPAAVARAAAPPAAYVQLPERRVWARPVENEAFEPLDGWFAYLGQGNEGLHALGVFGLHPDRMGFTVVEAAGPRTPGLVRADGSPLFAPTLPGAAAAGLSSITGAEELLELAWRAHDIPEDD